MAGKGSVKKNIYKLERSRFNIDQDVAEIIYNKEV